NRIGTIKQQRVDGSFYNFKTNVGGSTSIGLEAFAEYNVTKFAGIEKRIGKISLFASYAYNSARYSNFKIVSVVNNALSETNYKDKKVEYAPENILRAGLSHEWRGLTTTLQYSFTDKVYTDANNTEDPSVNGQNGLVPSYSVTDLAFGYRHKTGIQLKGGINNLSDARYFTRRAGGYPGPGVLPADGRTFYITLGYILK
ncbi:MAG: TonB-dependent receptor, partial [Bacteroidia bacterium]|nr:TonB-dependent receptor [Bacteroidia bacterium]